MTNLIFKRQLGFSNVVFEGFRIYLLKFREIFLITLVAIIPAIFLFGLRLDMQSRATSITGGTLFLFIILLLIELLVGTITSMSIAILAEKVVKRENVSVIDVLKIALSKWGGAFVTILLAGVIILAANSLVNHPRYHFFCKLCFCPSCNCIARQAWNKRTGLQPRSRERTMVASFLVHIGDGIDSMGSRPCHHISVEQTNRKFLSPYCDQFYSSNHKQRIHRHAGGVLFK